MKHCTPFATVRRSSIAALLLAGSALLSADASADAALSGRIHTLAKNTPDHVYYPEYHGYIQQGTSQQIYFGGSRCVGFAKPTDADLALMNQARVAGYGTNVSFQMSGTYRCYTGYAVIYGND